MDKNVTVDITEYYLTPLANITLPDKYNKLIKRIKSASEYNLSAETIADIVNLDPNEFSVYAGIGKSYVQALIEFKNELPRILELNQDSNVVLEENLFSTENFRQLEDPINSIEFSPKYQKLIKRIFAVMDNIATLQDIVNIDVEKFSKLPAIGKLYVEQLVSLQNALLPQDNKDESIEIAEIQLPLETILSKLYLNYSFLNDVEIKQLKKLEKFYGKAVDVRNVNTLLNLDKFQLAQQAGFGRSFLTALSDLQNRLKNELSALPENIAAYTIKQKGLFISSEIKFIEFKEIDAVLIEDVESYLWTLGEKEMDFALSRWGFNQKHETLEEVGSRYDITRERVRQVEKTINNGLLLSLRIQSKVLWANIREKMTEDLTILLPNLAKCFETEKLFYEFIELCCQVENGNIHKIVFTKISPKIINQLFCTNQSPIAHEAIVNELMSNYGYSKAAAINGLKQLAKLDKIKVTEQGIYPNRLGKIEAVAHVLTFHPAGLPWKDIARIVNKNNYSSTPFDETRQASGFANEFIYLSDHGTYRNLIFLDIEKFNIPEIMQHLLDYFKKNQTTTLHLHDYYYKTKELYCEIEYFTLRHIIREHGEERGVYFNGKSGTDSVSLDPEVTLISQSDVIIKVLNESKVAMTKQEIAERLRSKSKAHATFYLNKLMEEGRLVRVDQLVYTTPEKAFKSMDTKAVMMVIQDIMNTSSTIVEADVFREYVNLELNLSYSKYIYAALVRTKINELGWYRNGSLFSKNSIPYKSLADLCRQLCNRTLPNDKNAEILQQAVWLTRAVTEDALQWWKWQQKHNS
ncbi:hypothetical protein IVG45_01210 [Methylomonas sp. LL1]|uniref:sigma factor-like helix-turn-helix DNA-binding protein n=1 Tax=Methylomonas sp. LL1 TaxID=2785785 RepID=UPI0018C40118|nr:sigma factor-like helix-turn-helix DNA-binding protein [Methylomonas sp. LL1]QPK63630.1 hypothetical protein IVG45_01210 [Methylomonas sp. LL1]